jgi:hypothetical protein
MEASKGEGEWKEIGQHIAISKRGQTTTDRQDGEPEREQMNRALRAQRQEGETHRREAAWKDGVIEVTRYKKLTVGGREIWISIAARYNEVYETVGRELGLRGTNWEIWSEREWQCCETLRVVQRERDERRTGEITEEEDESDDDDESDARREGNSGKTEKDPQEPPNREEASGHTRLIFEGHQELIEIKAGTTDLQLRSRISGL